MLADTTYNVYLSAVEYVYLVTQTPAFLTFMPSHTRLRCSNQLQPADSIQYRDRPASSTYSQNKRDGYIYISALSVLLGVPTLVIILCGRPTF
jgi:hypothetical protein